MPIDRIPILSENYPLFDWDDHLQSYYALGQGELVSGFQKETWNAIIDKTLAALSAAGMNWDSTYTTAAKAKITEAYGPLSAKMFNSVRHNIDRPAPVGWGWANNPNLRGFVGREDFKGYADYGLNGDLFYAEYLLEMVRRLNLLLSIMKGTANLNEMDAPILSRTLAEHNLLALPSAPMAFSKPSTSDYICGLAAKKAGQFSFKDKSKSLNLATAHKIRSLPLGAEQLTASLQKSRMQMPKVAKLAQYTEIIPSISQAMMDIFNALYLSSALGISSSSSKATISIPQPRPIRAEEPSKTTDKATSIALSPDPMHATEIAKSDADAIIVAPEALPLVSTELGRTSIATVFERIRPRRMSGTEMGKATFVAILDTAWLAPIWVNGKLYIRQAFEANQTDTTLEVK